MEDIHLALRERILILDGAMGTVLQGRGLQGNSELFNLSHPEIVEDIHSEYIKAGADIISTNSFGANKISQHELGLSQKAPDMAEAAARIARRAADKAGRKVWVAGSVGPTGKSLTLAQNIGDPVFRPYSFDEMAAAYEEQIRALIAGGVDLLLLETCFDSLNAKAALYAVSKLENIPPIMISVSLGDKSGRTLTGQTPEAFYRSVRHCTPLSFGLNCSLGSREMIPLIAEVARFVDGAVSCYPNAGLPDAMGAYDESPQVMAAAIREMALQGSVNIVGGCCGTTPAHIAAIAAAVHGLPPRIVRSGEAENSWKPLYVSGLESVEIDRSRNFTNVGERTNVAGSRKFARLIASGDYEEALRIAAGQIENGADVIDINMDDAMLDSAKEMETFLRHIAGEPEVAKAAIMIDSSHWDTIVTGLKNAQGKSIVNSISLKEGEEIFLHKAREIKALGAALIVIAFDEEGQATTYDRKIAICQRAYSLLTEKAGYSPTDIIFDVNVLPVGTGIPEHSRYGIDFIEAVRWIKENLPGCRTSGGISNLSFAFRGNNAVREAMHTVFLYHAIKAGLDMGIVNPGMLKVYDEIDPELLRRVEDVILDSDPDATERLIDFAQEIMSAETGIGESGPWTPSSRKMEGPGSQESQGKLVFTDSPRDGRDRAERGVRTANACEGGFPSGKESVEERIKRALVKGDASGLEADLLECLGQYDGEAFKVIDGPLMDGMARVGELFGAGKMFLPQVVKSARTMKAAVELLQPHLEASASKASNRPRAVFATVKGDVHDIGKNITGIVFTCNGFEVTDLGVMVPKETILEEAARVKADIIGVSGLITPSLYQMELLCKDMEALGLDTPLLVGGAAASAVHTAVKLAPLYKHVFYGADASASAVLASKLVSDRMATEAAEHERQRALREAYEASASRPGQATGDAAPTLPSSPCASPEAGDAAASTGPDSLRYAPYPGKCSSGPVLTAAFPADSYIKGNPFRDLRARGLSVEEVEPFFDWGMFATILGARADRNHLEFMRLRSEGEAVLKELRSSGECRITISARFDLAHREGNDIISRDFRLPMFRQHSSSGNSADGLSLADFVPPSEYGFDSPMGMFAISVLLPPSPSASGGGQGRSSRPFSRIGRKAQGGWIGPCRRTTLQEEKQDDLVFRAVILTLAEAASSWLDEYVKSSIPDGAEFKVIKPAAGYSSCPDHTLKRDILRLLPAADALGITLLDSCAMIPEASICGLIFIHPEATYPEIRRLSSSEIDEYAARRGMSDSDKARFLGHLL
ncbi:MAG: homocysteine S-methyltransferase family protein [Bacteroidales bacterium]|nr:homocysteine S-methyltransferase family protein [Bacteroidales bacterium]